MCWYREHTGAVLQDDADEEEKEEERGAAVKICWVGAGE